MTKYRVLSILKQTNSYISGEKISEELGITRSAVNLAVKSLRQEGYEISSSTNKGYLFQPNVELDLLNPGELLALLPKERMKHVICLDSTDSTNNQLRNLAFEGAPSGTVVVANEQLTGRGRRGRSFSSPKNTGIYFSILFRPDCNPPECTTITAWTAVAVAKAIKRVTNVQPSIKWVNDLFLNRKKICGILSELSVESESGHVQHIIIGIGINVNQELHDFPEELHSIASSLYKETGKKISRAKLTSALIEEMDLLFTQWPTASKEYLSYYQEHNLSTKETMVMISGNSQLPIKVLGINEDFSLKIQTEDGKVMDLSSGEVSVKFQLTPSKF